jgi:hypothetical protein
VDTRHKILTPAQALEIPHLLRQQGLELDVVCGWFDPVTAGHVKRLRELARSGARLLALVADPPAGLLPARARAEMAASLAVLHYVLLAGGDSVDAWLSRLPASRVYREEAADEARREVLIRHVRSRDNDR